MHEDNVTSTQRIAQLLQEQLPLRRGQVGDDFVGIGQYPASGIKNSLHGNLYQLKLLTFFLCQGAQQGYDFCLATEMDAAEKFDDLVFRYQVPRQEQYHYRFLQAKHKQDVSKVIDWGALTTTDEGEFDLKKYFRSFLTVRQHIADAKLLPGNIQDCILCTNITLAASVISFLDEISEPDPFFNFNATEAKRYRFKPQFAERQALTTLFTANNELELLAQLLVGYTLNQEKIKLTTGLVKKYQHALTTILAKSAKGKAKFKPTFVNDFLTLSANTKALRTAFMRGLSRHQLTPEDLLTRELDVTDGVFKEIQGNLDFPPATTTDDVNAFLGCFVLAVGQPNQAELSKVLESKLSHVLNLGDGFVWAASLEKKVLNWMQEKTGSFINHQHATNFFSDLRAQLASFMLIGPTQWYCAVHRKTQIHFAKALAIDDFWQGSARCLVLHTQQLMHLVMLNLLQVVHARAEYQAQDTKLVLSAAMALDLQEDIRQALSVTSLRLVILECDRALTAEQVQQLLAICQHVLSRENIKLIVICEEKTVLHQQLSALAQPPLFKAVTPHITDLSEDAVNSFAQRTVTVSGETTTLGQLTNGFDANARRAFLTEALFPVLVEANSLEVPEYLTIRMKDFAKSCYIKRTMTRSTTIDMNKLAQASADRFVIANTTVTAMQQYFSAQAVMSIRNLDGTDLSQVRCVILETGYVSAQLSEVSKKFPHASIHLLVMSDGVLLWQDSYGGLGNLRDYLLPGSSAVTAAEVTFTPGQVTIISAIPGMGKSAVLEHHCDAHPQHVLHLRLKVNNTMLSEAHVDGIDDVMTLLCAMAGLTTPFAQHYVAYRLRYVPDLILQLDGFDEIAVAAQDTVIAMVKNLRQQSPTLQVVISTRPELCRKLENQFSQLAYDLVPLSFDDQVNYLMQYWSMWHKLDSNDATSQAKLDKYARELIQQFTAGITDTEAGFLGVPLQAAMLAESCKHDFLIYFQQEAVIVSCLLERLNVLSLYQKFVREKYVIYMQGKQSLPNELVLAHAMQEALNKSHQVLAFTRFFPDYLPRMQQCIGVTLLAPQQLLAVGVVTLNDDAIDFVHRTFAEYYIATLIVDYMSLPNDHALYQLARQLYAEQLHKPRYQVIVHFIGLLLSDTDNVQAKSCWHGLRDSLLCDLERDRQACIHLAKDEGEVVADERDEVSVTPTCLAEKLQKLSELERGNFDDVKHKIDDILFEISTLACSEFNSDALLPVLDKLSGFISSNWRHRYKYSGLCAWTTVAKRCIQQLYAQQQTPSEALTSALQWVSTLSRLSGGTSLSDSYKKSANENINYWETHTTPMLALIAREQQIDANYLQTLNAEKIALLVLVGKTLDREEYQSVCRQHKIFSDNADYQHLLEQVGGDAIDYAVVQLLRLGHFKTLSALLKRMPVQLNEEQCAKILVKFDALCKEDYYQDLMLELAQQTIHLPSIKKLLLDKRAVSIIDKIVEKNEKFNLTAADMQHLCSGQHLTWLEKAGARWVLRYKVLSRELATVFTAVYHEDRINGFHTNYVPCIFEGLALKLLPSVATRQARDINTYAFLQLVSESLHFSVNYHESRRMHTDELRQLCAVMERVLNLDFLTQPYLLIVIDCLIGVVKAINGQLLVTDQNIVVFDNAHDMDYRLSVHAQASMVSVLRWRLQHPTSDAMPTALYPAQQRVIPRRTGGQATSLLLMHPAPVSTQLAVGTTDDMLYAIKLPY